MNQDDDGYDTLQFTVLKYLNNLSSVMDTVISEEEETSSEDEVEEVHPEELPEVQVNITSTPFQHHLNTISTSFQYHFNTLSHDDTLAL